MIEYKEMRESLKTGRFLVFLGLLIGALAFWILPTKAVAAASLYLSPPVGTFSLDGTFSVSIYLNTGGQAVNAVEANLSFPTDKLQIVSPTAGKSLIQVWVSQPTYSNLDGTLTFRGTIPTPGINTDRGVISTVTFRVKNIGTAAVKILDSSRVLLNDGRGTDVLGGVTSGIYHLTLPPPAGPIVTSHTNPDQEKWYATKSVVFEWTSPFDTQGYSYILGQDPSGEPDDISEGVNTRVVYNNLPDGVYYFHIKSLRAGGWGGITDYVVRVDKTPPATFKLGISPGTRTSNRRPILDFRTTDAVSGISHYDLKIIPLDAPSALVGENSTPFFIEASSPYSRLLAEGRYQVVVRAYDGAENYYQAESRLTVVKPFFSVISEEGLSIGGYVLPWFYAGILAAAVLLTLYYLGKWIWRRHREVEEYLVRGILHHPSIADKWKAFSEKRKEHGTRTFSVLLLALLIFGIAKADSTQQNPVDNVSLEPPIVTLFPKSISNDEIVYVGGRAAAPEAKVLIYLQQVETGSTVSEVAVTDKGGAWFYSFPRFLNAGHYIAWTQLKIGDQSSPPSSKIDLIVAPTAIQIGPYRLSYEDFYFSLFILFAAAFLGLLSFFIYHSYHFRTKSRRLTLAVNEAEESIRRGFAILRQDIGAELDIVRKAKLNKELSFEESRREEKLLKDLEAVNRYISKEVWEIEKADY